MKIIDARGRLFGIINVFDMLVLCICISLAFFAVKWFYSKEDPSWIKMEISRTRCVGVTVNPEYMSGVIKEGDMMLDKDGKVVARIEQLLKDEPANVVTYSSKEGEKLFFNHSNRKITMAVSIVSYTRQDKVYSSITHQPIKIGESFLFDSKKYSIMINIREIFPKSGVQ